MSEMILILIFTLLSFLMGVAQFIFGGIIDLVANSIGVSIAAVGQLTTVYAISAAIGTPIIMMLMSTRPIHHSLFVGLASMMIGNGLMFFAPNFILLLFARSLVGLGSGIYSIASFSIVAEKAKPERRGRDLSMMAVGASLALVLGVPFSRTLTSIIDWQLIFLALSILLLVLLIVLIFGIKSTHTQEAIPFKEQVSYLINKQTAFLFLVTFSMFIGYSAMNTYVTPYLFNLSQDVESIITYVLLGLGISSVIGSRMSGVLSDKFGVEKVITFALFTQSIALILISIFGRIIWLVIPLLMVWAIGAWSCGPIFNLNFTNRFKKGTSVILSLNGTMVQFGFALGAILGGLVIESIGVSYMSMFAAIVVLISALLFRFEAKTQH